MRGNGPGDCPEGGAGARKNASSSCRVGKVRVVYWHRGPSSKSISAIPSSTKSDLGASSELWVILCRNLYRLPHKMKAAKQLHEGNSFYTANVVDIITS
jgi:hypothetical protein